jgi:uncharacterized membrane protein
MNPKLIYAILLTLLPITELRVGLPLAVSYANQEGIPFFLIFLIIVLLNILLIFFVFFFLDNLHGLLLNWGFYRGVFEKYIGHFRKRVNKFEKNYKSIGFLALVIFVGIPLPGTGAWSGCLVSWLIGLNRKKSILAIALGIIIAGSLVFLFSLGFMRFFS